MQIINVLYEYFDYLSNILYIGIFLNMMDVLFKRKSTVSQNIYYGLPVILFCVIYSFFEHHFGDTIVPYYLYFFILMGVNIISIAFLLEGAIIEKLIYFLYYFTVFKCIVFFLGGIIYAHESIMDKRVYMSLNVVTTAIPIIGLLLFRNFCIKYKLHKALEYLKNSQVALMLYCPFSLFTSFQLADPSLHIPNSVYISTSAILLLINVPIFYYLFAKIGESNEARITMGIALAETAQQLSRYKYSVIMEETAKKERHELKNKYFYIQTLLKENKLEQLDSFLTEHIGELSTNDSSIHTGNSLIDYILSNKLALAKRNNIKTYSEILIPENLNINEEYFCTVLLNLFDNAIEASLKEENPDIQVFLNVKNKYLVFCIKNKVSFDVISDNPNFKTSKANKDSHGLGMKIIKRSVRKSNGIFDTSMESGYFTATVMFPLLTL